MIRLAECTGAPGPGRAGHRHPPAGRRRAARPTPAAAGGLAGRGGAGASRGAASPTRGVSGGPRPGAPVRREPARSDLARHRLDLARDVEARHRGGDRQPGPPRVPALRARELPGRSGPRAGDGRGEAGAHARRPTAPHPVRGLQPGSSEPGGHARSARPQAVALPEPEGRVARGRDGDRAGAGPAAGPWCAARWPGGCRRSGWTSGPRSARGRGVSRRSRRAASATSAGPRPRGRRRRSGRSRCGAG